MISCKGLKCVPFGSSFLRLSCVQGKGNISRDSDSCHIASSAGRPFFSSTASLVFFLHNLLVSQTLKAPACISGCSLLCLCPPTPSQVSSMPFAPFLLSHSSAFSLLSPFLSFCHTPLLFRGTLTLVASCFGVGLLF